jgi:hypothetical protein
MDTLLFEINGLAVSPAPSPQFYPQKLCRTLSRRLSQGLPVMWKIRGSGCLKIKLGHFILINQGA